MLHCVKKVKQNYFRGVLVDPKPVELGVKMLGRNAKTAVEGIRGIFLMLLGFGQTLLQRIVNIRAFL